MSTNTILNSHGVPLYAGGGLSNIQVSSNIYATPTPDVPVELYYHREGRMIRVRGNMRASRTTIGSSSTFSFQGTDFEEDDLGPVENFEYGIAADEEYEDEDDD